MLNQVNPYGQEFDQLIIKYPFWQKTYANPNALYVCLNKGQAAAPKEIADQSICVDDDIAQIIRDLR